MKNTHGGVLLLLKLQEPATLLKETLLYGCFSCLWIVQMVPNHAKHHIYSYISQAYLYNIPMLLRYRAWKVSVFGVILVRIFPHSDWTRRDREYLSVFSPNAGKCGPEKFRIRSDRCGGYSKTWLKSVAFNRGFTVHDCKKNKITSYCYRKVGLNCIICKIKQQLSKVNKAQFKLLGYVEYV